MYNEKLKDLRVTGDEVKARAMDFETRPKAEEAMRQAIVHFRKFLDEHAAGDEKYAHISEEQVKKVADAVAEHEEWLNTKAAEQSNLPKVRMHVFLCVCCVCPSTLMIFSLPSPLTSFLSLSFQLTGDRLCFSGLLFVAAVLATGADDG